MQQISISRSVSAFCFTSLFHKRTMTITRPIPILQELLKNNELLLSEKLKLAIELHIASLLEEDQPKARQQLPFLVQF